jgi:diguanylate cyclase
MRTNVKKIWKKYESKLFVHRKRAAQSFDNLGQLYIVADFLGRHDIDPNPRNYELVYRHQVLEEKALESDIETLLRTPATNQWAASFDANPLSGAELRKIADEVQLQLKTVEKTIGNYAKETKGYGNALEEKEAYIEAATDHGAVIDQLIQLTRKMVEKAHEAERELKDRNEAVKALKTSLADAKIKADTDMLTGLSNRRAFERALGAACERASLAKIPVSLAICDVDHFKSINDQFGHVTGDRVLKLIGEILESHCGAHGNVCRFGGEEFVILFEGIGVEEAFDLVERAKVDLSDRKLVKRETKEAIGRVTFSAGLATYSQAQSPEALLHIADLALYEAKAAGRDCIFGAGIN